MKIIPVNDLKKVDVTRYKEGDFFFSHKQFGVLHDGQVNPLVKQSDLKDYVKKKDVVKLINEAVKKKEEVK